MMPAKTDGAAREPIHPSPMLITQMDPTKNISGIKRFRRKVPKIDDLYHL